ncbi:MAG TPA: hypothetical protein VK844_05460, partial [Hyphomicrobiales bacterium]|nr:hypothetical protein [Hyphomicrobiales bacterium]
MLFTRKRWAHRVVERMGVPSSSPAAAELLDMIMSGVNQCREALRRTGMKASEPEQVLLSVAAMSFSDSAFKRLYRAGHDANGLLAAAREAGLKLCLENGFHELVVLFHRRDVDDSLAAARQMPADTRRLMVKGLEATYCQIDSQAAVEKKAGTLALISKYAQQRRRKATHEGTDTHENPVWNVTSCIDSVAKAELIALKAPQVDPQV